MRAEGDAGAIIPVPDGIPDGGGLCTGADCGQKDPLSARRAVSAREMPFLVELAVGGQVGLRCDAAHDTALNDDGAVVEAAAVPQGRADDDRREKAGGGRANGLDGGEDLVEQHVAE